MVTKKVILDAAYRLMAKKSLDRITVTDIAAECQITRQTFYYHFQDILEMVEWGMQNEVEKLTVKGKNAESIEEALMLYCQAVMEKRDFFSKIVESRYNRQLTPMLAEHLRNYIVQIVQKRVELEERPAKDMFFLVRYHAGAVAAMLVEWLLGKEPVNLEYEISQISRIIRGELHG
ncbi:MAG: TetR family transcriptional regulator [Brotaphodocola sp.]